MRDLLSPEINKWRVKDQRVLQHWGWIGDGTCGMFMIPSCVDRKDMAAIASSGEGWDHVSVSRRNRPPIWREMEQVAALFFKEDEVAFQLHVPTVEHINDHKNCLHWWRPQDQPIPRPPLVFV